MSVKGIIMFLRMNNTRLERKTLIILDFENGFLPTYLPQWAGTLLKVNTAFTVIIDLFVESSIGDLL